MEGFDIEVYMQTIKQELLNTFGDELVYLGLQGSFRRGEARESSDIDVMVILEEFTVERMAEYREILKRVGNFNKSCGFICGRKEMKNWNRFEICQLLHETKDYYGILSQLVPAYSRQDVQDYLKTGAGNLYHELCHRYIHAPDTLQEVLPFLYKGTFYLAAKPSLAEHRRISSGQNRTFDLPEWAGSNSFAGLELRCGREYPANRRKP